LSQPDAGELQAELIPIDPTHESLIDSERPLKIRKKNRDRLQHIRTFTSTMVSALQPLVDSSSTLASPFKFVIAEEEHAKGERQSSATPIPYVLGFKIR